MPDTNPTSTPTPATDTPPSPGPRTTEFWKSLAITAVGLTLVLVGALKSPMNETIIGIGAALAGLTTAGYAISRGLSKSAPLLALVLIPAILLGCAGQQARNRSLIPALTLAGPTVIEQAKEGVPFTPPPHQPQEAADIDALTSALDSKNPDGLLTSYRVNWPGVKEAALAKIEHDLAAGAIGTHVANILREQVFQFGADLARLAPPSPTGTAPTTPIGSR